MTKEEKPGPGGTGGGRERFDVQDGKGVHCSAYERGDVVWNLESVTDKIPGGGSDRLIGHVKTDCDGCEQGMSRFLPLVGSTPAPCSRCHVSGALPFLAMLIDIIIKAIGNLLSPESYLERAQPSQMPAMAAGSTRHDRCERSQTLRRTQGSHTSSQTLRCLFTCTQQRS